MQIGTDALQLIELASRYEHEPAAGGDQTFQSAEGFRENGPLGSESAVVVGAENEIAHARKRASGMPPLGPLSVPTVRGAIRARCGGVIPGRRGGVICAASVGFARR